MAKQVLFIPHAVRFCAWFSCPRFFNLRHNILFLNTWFRMIQKLVFCSGSTRFADVNYSGRHRFLSFVPQISFTFPYYPNFSCTKPRGARYINVINLEKNSWFIYHSVKFYNLSTAIQICERLSFHRKYSGI